MFRWYLVQLQNRILLATMAGLAVAAFALGVAVGVWQCYGDR